MKHAIWICMVLLSGITPANKKATIFYLTCETCISRDELLLYRMINDYREDLGLAAIPLSQSLTIVAQTHVKDLEANKPNRKYCNLHSWSSKGQWTSCCYTDDHDEAECMWNKPGELTTYPDVGYEIAFYSNFPDDVANLPEASLKAWKMSRGHHTMIINRGEWDDADWQALGVGISGGYAVVWFGESIDLQGVPELCSE